MGRGRFNRTSSRTAAFWKASSQRVSQTVAHKFVGVVQAKAKNFDVMRTMYAPDIVSVEGDGKQTSGQGPVIKKSEDWVSDKTFNGGETVAGPRALSTAVPRTP